MTSSRLKAGLGVLVIFILGCICGGLIASVIIHKRMASVFGGGPQAISAALERHLTNRLDLDEGQRAQVHEFLAANLRERHQITAPIEPDIRALNIKTFQQINSILRPDQKEKFHRVIAAFRQQYGRSMVNGGAPAEAPVGATAPANAPATTNAPPATSP